MQVNYSADVTISYISAIHRGILRQICDASYNAICTAAFPLNDELFSLCSNIFRFNNTPIYVLVQGHHQSHMYIATDAMSIFSLNCAEIT